jgi:lipoprotein-releasing system ATP-binding protein
LSISKIIYAFSSSRFPVGSSPSTILGSFTTEIVYELLRDINKRYKTTFIIITHDKRVAEKADRIIEIKDGRIEMDLSRKI